MELLRELTANEKRCLAEWLKLGNKADAECPFTDLIDCNPFYPYCAVLSCHPDKPYCKELIKGHPTKGCPCNLFGFETMVEFAKEILGL